MTTQSLQEYGGSSTTHHHPSTATTPAALKRKSPSPPSSPSDQPPSPKKRITTLPPPFAASTTTTFSPLIPSKSPPFSPFTKRVSEKSSFTASFTTTQPISPPPFSRFTTNNNNKTSLRRTLSEPPPVFDSFASFVKYMKNSQSPQNTNNTKPHIPLRRSISDATNILKPSLDSQENTKRKRLEQFLNDAEDKKGTILDNENNKSNNSERPKQFLNKEGEIDAKQETITFLREYQTEIYKPIIQSMKLSS